MGGSEAVGELWGLGLGKGVGLRLLWELQRKYAVVGKSCDLGNKVW